ncbi:hypothetical protein FRB90_000080 [Tulasnella sp. 427]|nr:hypothetical protein FRB90_000080 [Tulasnella sp. 427]
MTKPRDQLGWYSATEWLLRSTIAVHGFGHNFNSSRNTATENDVEEVFADYGRILHVQFWQSQNGGVWAFVTFAHKEERDAAIQARDGRPVDLRSRDGRRHIKWDTRLKVVEPRFHSVRFYYDQFAAVDIVPREIEFTPSARPGHGATFQLARARIRRPLLRPPTSRLHRRQRSETLLSNTNHHSIHDRSLSPAPSIQWGHEEAATPEPASPAYNVEEIIYHSIYGSPSSPTPSIEWGHEGPATLETASLAYNALGIMHDSLYGNPSSPAPSIEWGHERSATPAYDLEDMLYSAIEPVPWNDDEEDRPRSDGGYDPFNVAQDYSSVQNFPEQPASRDGDSPQHYGDHEGVPPHFAVCLQQTTEVRSGPKQSSSVTCSRFFDIKECATDSSSSRPLSESGYSIYSNSPGPIESPCFSTSQQEPSISFKSMQQIGMETENYEARQSPRSWHPSVRKRGDEHDASLRGGTSSASLSTLMDDIGSLITSMSSVAVKINGRFCDVFEGLHVTAGKVALKRPRIGSTGYDTDVIRIYQTADAICYLHANGVVHGDIKGSNILISDTNHVLLCDFGLTKVAPSQTSTSLKGAGTTRWQSPELLNGAPKTFKSDVYAFGMTIAEILKGTVPFDHLIYDGPVIVAVLKGERPSKVPSTSITGGSYDIVWEVAERCWAEDPEARTSMLDAFSDLQKDVSLTDIYSE